MVDHSTRTKRGISLVFDFLDPPYDREGKSGWGHLYPTDQVVSMFDDVLNITKPNRILEIGFYKGHSTAIWAELFDGEIVSCCPDHPMFQKWSPIIEQKYPNVKVFGVESPLITGMVPRNTDLIFIDGNHTFYNVVLDITAATKLLNGKWVFFDDHENPRVRDAIAEFPLDLSVSKVYNIDDKEFGLYEIRTHDI